MPFDYFDEIRKVLETAQRDVLFVDPYLDAEFVSRYLGHIPAGVSIRLLARERIQTLIPAVELYAKQSNTKIEVRSAAGFHDRYLFVDNSGCYQSGASFKDGAKKAPTTVTQIIDAFPAVGCHLGGLGSLWLDLHSCKPPLLSTIEGDIISAELKPRQTGLIEQV